MTRNIEEFQPREKEAVKIFTCGPSIYQPAHLGNYRTFLFEDILVRYLQYSGYNVKRTLNFTDIEDKTIKEAEIAQIDIFELTHSNAEKFLRDFQKLHMLQPTYNPRATTSIDSAVKIIEKLLVSNHAYIYNENIYFDIRSFKNFGKLSHLKKSDWPKKIRRYHKDTYIGNNWNIGDFILWHGNRNEKDFSWDTSIGKGRPSWNIQDPAMLCATLGPTIDIWCGGEDNLIRHHDYNIAIMEAATEKELSKYWLHGGHLLVDGKKMSKSRGNVIYLDNLLKKGYTSQEIRFFLLSNHYKKRLNFTSKSIEQKTFRLRHLKNVLETLSNSSYNNENKNVSKLIKSIIPKFKSCMDENLDIILAFNSLEKIVFKLQNSYNKSEFSKKNAMELKKSIDSINEVLKIF